MLLIEAQKGMLAQITKKGPEWPHVLSAGYNDFTNDPYLRCACFLPVVLVLPGLCDMVQSFILLPLGLATICLIVLFVLLYSVRFMSYSRNTPVHLLHAHIDAVLKEPWFIIKYTSFEYTCKYLMVDIVLLLFCHLHCTTNFHNSPIQNLLIKMIILLNERT